MDKILTLNPYFKFKNYICKDDGNNDGDNYGDNGDNNVVRVRSRSSAVPTRQMPFRAAKAGVKKYYVDDSDD
jgi:hypothetical protein